MLYLLILKKKCSSHTSKKNMSSISYNIFNNLDNKVPTQSQSLFNIYVIDSFCDHVRVCDNDTVPFTNIINTVSNDDVVPEIKHGSNVVNARDCVHNNDCDCDCDCNNNDCDQVNNTQINSNEEPCTVQYSKHRNIPDIVPDTI